MKTKNLSVTIRIQSRHGYGAAFADNMVALVQRGEVVKAKKLLAEIHSLARQVDVAPVKGHSDPKYFKGRK